MRLAAVLAAGLVLTGCSAQAPSGPTSGVSRATAPARPPVTPPPSADPAPGPTVQQITAALDGIHPTRHPRDNTGSCAGSGCLGLVTAGTVSIYQWPTVTAASRFVGEGAGTADRIGPYVLSYRTTEQRSTPPQVRKAYADRLRALVGPAP